MPPPARTSTTSRASAHKGHGQWALGHLEPLTPNERVKKDDDGLNVRARIENIYAAGGFPPPQPVPHHSHCPLLLDGSHKQSQCLGQP